MRGRGLLHRRAARAAITLPLLDVSLVTISRIRRGVNPFTTAGKDHLSHRLVNRGFTERESVVLLYLLAGVGGMIAMFITQASITEGYMIGGFVAALGLYAIYQLERVKSQPQ